MAGLAGLSLGVALSMAAWATRRPAPADGAERTRPVPTACAARGLELLHAMPVAAGLADAGGRVVAVNALWCALTGLTGEESAGDGWRQVLDPPDRARVQESWSLMVAFCEHQSDEYRLRRPTGESRWVRASITPIHAASGELTGHLIVIDDVTCRREVAARLARCEEELRLVGQALAVARFDWDFELNRISWSPELAALLALGEGQPAATPSALAALAHPADRELLQRVITAHLAGRAPSLRCEVRLLCATGTYEPFVVTGAAARDADGRPRRLCGAVAPVARSAAA